MLQLNLQGSLRGSRPLTKNLEDQPGAVDHFCFPGALQIALLARAEGAVHDHQADLLLLDPGGVLLNFAGAQKCPRMDAGQVDNFTGHNFQANRPRQTGRLFQFQGLIANITGPRLARRGPLSAQGRVQDQSPLSRPDPRNKFFLFTLLGACHVTLQKGFPGPDSILGLFLIAIVQADGMGRHDG